MNLNERLTDLVVEFDRERQENAAAVSQLRTDLDMVGEAVARLIVMCQSSGAIPRASQAGYVVIVGDDGHLPGQTPLWP